MICAALLVATLLARAQGQRRVSVLIFTSSGHIPLTLRGASPSTPHKGLKPLGPPEAACSARTPHRDLRGTSQPVRTSVIRPGKYCSNNIFKQRKWRVILPAKFHLPDPSDLRHVSKQAVSRSLRRSPIAALRACSLGTDTPRTAIFKCN